jgi:hypothetical protein
MQQQERDLIADLYGRLQQFENQPRDPEAERLIASYVTRQPSAVYLLTQTVLVQEDALKQAKARIAELESKASETSFLGSAPKVSPWGSAPTAAPPPPPARPWQVAPPAPQQMQAPAPAPAAAPAGGSFMRTALTTAAGVAGGALLFQGISSMFGHGNQAHANQANNPSSLMPSDQSMSSGDMGQDVAAAGNYDAGFDDAGSGYDSSSDNDDI